MTDALLPYYLYGLDGGNPYAHRELDPLTQPDDCGRLLGLDGFVEHEPVSGYLERKAAARQPALVLVGGRNLTGRTSMANWVLDKYFKLREVQGRFVLVRVEVKDQDTFRWLSKAMAQLWRNTVKSPPPGLTLTDDVRTGLKDNLTVTNTPIYEELFQASVHDLSEELTHLKNPFGLGFVFEGVPTPQFVAAATDVFTDCAAVVVFTYDDYDHAQTTEAAGFRVQQFHDMLNVYLEPLGNQQVCLLARGRWDNASELEFPFDPEGLEELYRNRLTPIKTVLGRLEGILDYRLGLVGPDGAPWPENDDLFMSAHWLRTTFKFKESSS